jgi:2-polyprenyl-3-methyl-5-hydroxy-6-metoxy-1,4-benzoquinol methylase
MRQKETLYVELGLDNSTLTDTQLLDAMLAHPILINRPFVVTSKGTRLCRPCELVLDILPSAQKNLSTIQPQNIYDDPTFFIGYKNLRQNDTGLNGAIEVPALCQLLPDLTGSNVLDLGCGFGDFARYARQKGATSVTALDVSTNMLEEAVRLTDDPQIHYVQCAIEQFQAPAQLFDLIVSSLALHYVENYSAVTQRVFDALKPAGQFIFSVEHPVCTANPTGWIRNDKDEVLYWPLNHYQTEGQRNTSWFIEGVRKYHRTMATYINVLLSVGFKLDFLGEPTPTAEALAMRPQLQIENCRPPFLLIAVSRP